MDGLGQTAHALKPAEEMGADAEPSARRAYFAEPPSSFSPLDNHYRILYIRCIASPVVESMSISLRLDRVKESLPHHWE
jgi:hypothetical protein